MNDTIVLTINDEKKVPPLLLLGACAQCGASADSIGHPWIELVQTFTGYSHVSIDFNADGSVSAYNESNADLQWDSGETQEARCSECGATLGKAQELALDEMFG